MASTPVRFGQGQGLEVAPGPKLQAGLLELENVDLDTRGVIEKRSGAASVGLQKSATPSDDIAAADTRALWYRDDELLLETDAELFGRTSYLDGDWRRKGAWSRHSLREERVRDLAEESPTTSGIISGAAAIAVNGNNRAAYAVWELGTVVVGLYLDVLSDDGLSQSVLVDAIGKKPQISPYKGTDVLITYESGTDLKQVFCDPELGTPVLVPAFANAIGQWTQITGTIGAENYYGYGAQVVNDSLLFRFVPDGSLTTIAVSNTFGGVIGDMGDVSMWPVSQTGNVLDVMWAATGVRPPGYTQQYVAGGHFTADFDAGTITPVWTHSQNLPDSARAVSVYASGTSEIETYCELDDGVNKPYIEFWKLTSSLTSSEFAVRKDNVSLCSTHLETGGGYGAAWISANGDDLVARSGHFLYAAATGEVVARAGIGFTEDEAERDLRNDKTNFNATADGEMIVGFPMRQSVTAPDLKQGVVYRLKPMAANSPGVLNGTAVSAHAGYPRMTDSSVCCEHDWHQLPEIGAIATPAASLPAGDYGIALTFEWRDRFGRLYRSAPSFKTVTLLVNTRPSVAFNALTFTERPDVVIVGWRTVAFGTIYYRTSSLRADVASSIEMVETDAQILSRETLRQVPGGRVFSVPTSITDFVAAGNDRFWSRSSKRGTVCHFTNARVEGFGLSWGGPELAVEHQENDNLTAVAEMDGRIVLMGSRTLAYTQGSGPEPNGLPLFPAPLNVPVIDGATGQPTVTRVPEGLLYGSVNGPKLLSRSLQVSELSEMVSRLYRVDGGTVVATAYVPSTRTAFFVDDGGSATLRLHAGTGRWATEGGRQCKDIAQTGATRLAWLTTAGAVLEEDSSIFTDGGAGYTSKVRTGWIRRGDTPSHAPLDFRGVFVIGERIGAHGLKIEVFFDYSEAVAFTKTFPEAQVTANEAVRPYLYAPYVGGRSCYAVSVRVSDLAEGVATWRLEGLDIIWEPVGRGGPAQLHEDHEK